MKRLPWFEILLIVIVMSTSLYAALSDAQNLSVRWFTRDDAYYYFKVAQNISEGHGSTFDGINPTNGYHPLWMLVCIPIFALARFDLILPLRILLLVMSGLSVATAILLYRLIGRIFSPPIGAITALYWVFSHEVLVTLYQQGLESGIAAFFIVLLVYKLFEFDQDWRVHAVSNKELVLLGILATLAMLSRLDLIFLASFTGIWIIFRGRPLRHFLPMDIISIVISVLLAFLIRIPLPEYYGFSKVAVTMIALSLAIKIPAAYFLGLYQNSIVFNFKKLAARLASWALIGSTLVGIGMMVLARIFQFEGFPKVAMVYDLILSSFFLGLSRIAVIGLRTERSPIQESITPFSELQTHYKQWMREGAIYFGIIGGALALYMLVNKTLFGTFSPVSGQIKRWWGSLPGNVYGGVAKDPYSFFGISYQGDMNAWHPVSTLLGGWAERISLPNAYLLFLIFFGLLFYFVLIADRRKAKTSIVQLSCIPIACSAWLQILYYNISGYSASKEWYWISELILVVLTASLILGMLFGLIHKSRYRNIAAWTLVIGTGLYMGVAFWKNIQVVMTYNEWKPTDPYDDTSPFLEQHTEAGSIIGMTGGGNAGYFIHDRTIINLDGLINSYEYFRLLQNRQAGEYLAHIGMDYILANPDILNQLPYKGQYQIYMEATNNKLGGKELFRYHLQQP